MSSDSGSETRAPSTYPSYLPLQRSRSGLYANIGLLCAFIALWVLPEIFGTAAAILGAYAFRMDFNTTSNRGIFAVIVGVIFMLVGIYYTSFFGLYNILP